MRFNIKTRILLINVGGQIKTKMYRKILNIILLMSKK